MGIARGIVALSLAVVLGTAPAASRAQILPQGVLDTPVSVRSVGMGISGAADPSGPGNAYLNPAVIAFVDGVQGSFAYYNPFEFLPDEATFFNDTRFYSLAVSWGRQAAGGRWNPAFGVDVRFAETGFGETTITDLTGRDLGRIEPSDRYVSVAAAGRADLPGGLRLGVGGAIKPYRSRAFGSRTDGGETTAYDVGAIITASFGDAWSVTPSIGLSAVNMGDDAEVALSDASSLRQSVLLPQATRIGLSVRIASPIAQRLSERWGRDIPIMSVVVNGDARRPEDDDDTNEYGVGVELGFYETGYVRIALADSDRTDPDAIVGFGVAVSNGRIWARLDYARVEPDVGDGANRIGGVVALLY